MNALRLPLLLLAAVFGMLAAPARAEVITAFEFDNPGLDHYFVTASEVEIRALDNGEFKGWFRTGGLFGVFTPDSTDPGLTPVCRFYGNPAFGLDSHFYSASPAECADVLRKWPEQWLLESSNVFKVRLPDTATGACPSGTQPLYRAFNQRTDVNHRYTIILTFAYEMVDKGYALEGYGSPPVAMCVPFPPGQIAVPVCEIDARHSEPVATETNTLSARCSNHPTLWTWTNCKGQDDACEATSAVPGPVTYTLVATNGVGQSAPATRTLNWEARPPRCAIGISTTAPPIGVPQTLYASCDGNPTAFFWTNCESKGDTCIATASSPGPRTYTLYAANAWGTGAPYAQTLDWQQVTPICTVTSNILSASVATLKAKCDGSPTSYQWTNCASTTDTCTATSTVTGAIAYTVRGVNAYGAGSPASVVVEWPGPRPVCTISASSTAPITGSELTLTASCTGFPYNYLWRGCLGTGGKTCTDIALAAGTRTYSVQATNLTGEGEPVAVDITWVAGLAAPVCSLFVSGGSPYVGSLQTIIASCTGNPTSYQWTGCASTTSMCTTTSAVPGDQTYTVSATNAAGTSKTYSTTIPWFGLPPSCTLSASQLTPKVGTSVTLTAVCAEPPLSYSWFGCSSDTATCIATSAVPGIKDYDVRPVNAWGTSIVRLQLDWQP